MRRQALTALVLFPVLALGASACGNGSAADPVTAQRAKAADDLTKMRQFAKCMRENGVDMPDPSEENGRIKVQQRVDAGKGGELKRKAAERKCRHLMPNGGKPVKPNAEQLAKLREMAKCMRENGVPDFPDPDPNGGGIMIKKGRGGGSEGPGPRLDPEDPVFAKAEKKCRPKGALGPATKEKGN